MKLCNAFKGCSQCLYWESAQGTENPIAKNVDLMPSSQTILAVFL